MKNNEKAFVIILGVLVLCLIVGGGILIWQNNERIKILENDLNNKKATDNDTINNNNNNANSDSSNINNNQTENNTNQEKKLKINESIINNINLTNDQLKEKYGEVTEIINGNSIRKEYKNTNLAFMFSLDFDKEGYPAMDNCYGVRCQLKDFILNINEENISIEKIKALLPGLDVGQSGVDDSKDVCTATYNNWVEVKFDIKHNQSIIPTNTVIDVYAKQ